MNIPNLVLQAALLSTLLCPSAMAAAGSSLYGDSLAKYNAGMYPQAASGFLSASQTDPSNQLYHYLFANCLVHLELHKRAVEEYKAAYVLDPMSNTGALCRKALRGYGKSVPIVASARLAGGNDEVDRVKALIQRQANVEKDKHDSLVNRTEQSAKNKIDEDLRQIDQWMQNEIQKLNDPVSYIGVPHPNPLLRTPDLLKEKEDEVRAEARELKEQLKKDAGKQTKLSESWRREREAMLEEAADNLQTQLDQPVGRSGVKLQAHGTGFYVRYYGSGGTNYLPDPHQATARIKDAADGDSDGTPAAVTDASSVKQAESESVKNVKGAVLMH